MGHVGQGNPTTLSAEWSGRMRVSGFSPWQGDPSHTSANGSSFVKRPRGVLWRLRVAAVAVFLLPASASLSGPVSWVTDADSYWEIVPNWSSNPLLPGALDDVTIGVGGATVRTITHWTGTDTINSLSCNENIALSGGSLSISQASSIGGQLLLSSGTFTGAGDLTVTGGINWTDGTMSGTGRTVIAPGGVLSLSPSSTNPLTLSRAIENNGAANWTWASTTNATCSLNLSNGAVFNNTGVFSASNVSGFTLMSGSGGSSFNNAGTFNRSGSGSTTISMPFNNTGTVNVQGGTLALSGGGASSGTFTVDVAGTLQLLGSSSYAFNAGSVISGSGALALKGGTLTGTGDLTVTGGINWRGGTMSGPGRTVIAPDGVLILNTATADLTLSRAVENNGTTTWAIGTKFIYLRGGTFNNTATGVFNVSAAATMNAYSGIGTGDFSNAGTFNRSGTGTTTIAVPFNNTGTVNVQSGTLFLNGGGASSGTFNIDAAGVFPLYDGYPYSFNAGAVISGSGALALNGGTLAGTGDLTVTGGINWTGGGMTGSGRTVIAAGGVLTVNTASTSLWLSRVVENNGATTWATGTNTFYLSGGTFNNNATGVFNVSAAATMYANGGSGTSAFNNAGTFNRSGPGTTTIDTPFNNAGTVNVHGGTLLLRGGASSGIFNIDAGGTLFWPGGYSYSLNAGSSISGSGTLALNGGTLTGTGDLTVTGGINWTGGTMSGTGRTVIAAGGVLTLNTASTSLALSRVVENNGTTTWVTGPKFLYLSGGTFNNNATGVFNTSAAATMYPNGGTNAFNNAGTFNRSGTGTTEIRVPFNNTGAVNVQGGTLLLSGGGTSSGTLSIASEATLTSNGAFSHTAGLFGGEGKFRVAGRMATISGPQQWAAGAQVEVTAGTLILNTDAGSSAARSLSIVATGGQIQFHSPQHLAGLSIDHAAAAIAAGGMNTLVLDSLHLGAGASLDMADNNAILHYTGDSPADAIQAWLHAGAIFSSVKPTPDAIMAVGTADNAMLHLQNWNGESLTAGLDFKEILLVYTYLGDTNLDGKVDDGDYLNIIANMGRTGVTWFEGDLNHDGTVDASDYNVVADHLGAGVTPEFQMPAIFGLATAVPEPGVLALLAGGAAMLVQRRRRQG